MWTFWGGCGTLTLEHFEKSKMADGSHFEYEPFNIFVSNWSKNSCNTSNQTNLRTKNSFLMLIFTKNNFLHHKSNMAAIFNIDLPYLCI